MKKVADSLEKLVFIVCPVRNMKEEEQKFLQDYVSQLEAQGYKVHFPPRDTNQNDSVGLAICSQNRDAMQKSDEVHVYWNASSEGTKFDFGMLFMSEKPLVLINKKDVQRTPHKSFENVLLELDARYRFG